jgi:hypothetical protein
VSRRGDAFDILSSHDPVDETRLDDHRSPRARQLFESIVATPGHVATRRRRRLRTFAFAAIAVATMGAAWIVFHPISNPTAVTCYQAVSLDSDAVGIASGSTLDPSACVSAWEDGPLVNEEIVPRGTVPPLVGCVTDAGTLAVFPSDDPAVCEQLGLARPDSESIAPGEVVGDLQDALTDYFATHQCVSIDQARDAVENILTDRGMSQWTIETGPAQPDRPCASFGMDPENTTIYLVPIEDLGG